MARIFELQIPPEERTMCRSFVKNLIHVYRSKQFTKGSIDRIFSEWEGIARRIKNGEKLIEEASGAVKEENPISAAHYQSLCDLYFLLVRLCAIYEGFFHTSFPPEKTEQHRKVQEMTERIRSILIA